MRLDERIRFPTELPITAHVEELAKAIEAHSVVIVAGETGSGKTTQLPKLCLAMGRAAGRQIACTQPRRIAATSVAARVAQELDTQLGDVVGYKVRFTDRVKATSAIKFMTDGMLLAEIQGDPLLRTYDTIIIDEAHERSLNIDFLLGFMKRLVERRRDLRVVISSATLEIERFQKFFGGAPVVQVSGRTYPVDVIYRPPNEDEADLAEHVANVVNEITELDGRGDILVFLPGEREIREAIGELEQRALPHTELLPLYARLSVPEQQRVFQAGGRRRVVLATNVAETSLTIPGIVYVVDPGVARVNRYDVRTGVSQLLVEPISRASADQRKGRCGRVQSGVCFRLYEEQDFVSRPTHTDPEIKRVGLAGVILRMLSLGLGDIAAFPFLDPPQTRAIGEGYRTLEELGALDETRTLTPIGEQLGRLPLDPRLGRMILGGRDERALREVVIIASVLGLQDPRERPMAERQRADEQHRQFREEGSDFIGYLKLFAAWRDARGTKSRRQLQRWCHDHFLSYVRMREWDDIHEQIVRVMKELEFAPNREHASGDQIHRALLPGLLSKIGLWNQEARIYLGARQTRFVIHPSSALGKKPPQWIMAAELVETSQLFARTVAKLDPTWIEAVAGPLCRRSHGDPHWEQKAGQVIAREQVTLFGLPIVTNRPVPYAQHDPALCRDLFITHALVRHEYTTKGAFMDHNRAVQAEVQHLRDKARRSDMFADEDALFAFFDRKLPASVVSGKTFEAWRREAEARDPKVLFLVLADLLVGEERDLSPTQYPDELVIGSTRMPLAYRFDPGEDDDGVTVTVPLAVLPALDPAVMAWTIPGWHRAKMVALLDSLPKSQRKALGAPVDEVAGILAKQLRPFDGAMLPAVERAALDVTGQRISRDQWDLRTLPHYLDFTFRVVDDHDKVLGSGRDLAQLQRELAGRAQKLWAAAPRASFEKKNLRGWDFDTLPESVQIEVSGRRVAAYPALVDVDASVELRLLESPAAARAATREGLRRLYMIQSQVSMSKLEAQLPATLARDLRRDLVHRALDEAYDLDAELPRDRATFTHRLAEGRGLVAGILAELARYATEIATHVTKIQTVLRPLVGKPGIIKGLVEDVQSQLAHLVPADVFRTTSLARLAHVVRYLQALQVRLQRQAHDPPKDAQKAAPVAPIWQAYLARKAELLARGRRPDELEAFRWLVEELRVQIFAPELRTAVPVSLPRVQDLWAGLVR